MEGRNEEESVTTPISFSPFDYFVIQVHEAIMNLNGISQWL
jgi:hypothetical protein